MDAVIVGLLGFFAAAIPAQLLWGRMRRILRDRKIPYYRWSRTDALFKYADYVRRGQLHSGERRMLLWVYVATGLTWAAFLVLVYTVALASR